MKNPALGIANHSEEKIVVYPVPSNHMLFIESGDNIRFVTIRNAEGKEVYNSRFSGNIDVSSFSSGVYFVQLLDSGKKMIAKKRIVIK